MNLEQFNKLNEQDRVLVAEAYFDAWLAATNVVKSYEVRTGDTYHDGIVRSTTESIARILEYSLEKMKED